MNFGFDESRLYRPADPEMRTIASPGVLSQWRHFARGPSYIRVNSKIFYAGSDVIRWLQEHRVEPTGEAA